MPKQRNIHAWLIALVLIVSGIASSQEKNRNSGRQEKTSNDLPAPLPADQIVAITYDLLTALSEFRISTMRDPAADESLDAISEMKALMDQSAALKRGAAIVKKYSDSQNQIVKICGKGSWAGATMIIDANDKILSLLRKPDFSPAEFQFQMAQAAHKRSEGYQLIFKSLGWVTALMFRIIEKDKQHGPIPYNISRVQRTELIDRINKMFGDDIRSDEEQRIKDHTVNFMVQAAKYIRDTITPDTYEQLAEKEGQNRTTNQ